MDPNIDSLTRLAATHGLRITPVLRKAGVAKSTWKRAKEGAAMRARTVRRIERAIARLTKEKRSGPQNARRSTDSVPPTA